MFAEGDGTVVGLGAKKDNLFPLRSSDQSSLGAVVYFCLFLFCIHGDGSPIAQRQDKVLNFVF